MTSFGSSSGFAASLTSVLPEFLPCSPSSEFIEDVSSLNQTDRELPDLGFCSEWNPEFTHNGHHCCGGYIRTRRRHRKLKCAPERRKFRYCDEMTEEQKEYAEEVQSGKLGDILQLITQEMGGRGEQAYCTVNNGFLAHGRRLIPSALNHVAIRSPERCVDFGTDGMIGMIEYVGREVGKRFSGEEYKGVKLVVGDIAAPRGGCLGHASHTTGQDADIGFLWAKPGRDSPIELHRDFDVKTEWWLIKQFFSNPYACIKVMFLDRRLINKLAKSVSQDEDWQKYRRFIRHMPGHRNHVHVRIGDYPGPPGCVADAKPELEELEDASDTDYPDLSAE